MPISDKTRKLLWGKSGNRCAICGNKLAVDATETDPDSIVGDECHIVSGQPSGPRYESSFPQGEIDSYDNLILLCKVHHKNVDDQPETYTAVSLKALKAKHEKSVAEKLDKGEVTPVRVRRIKENIPEALIHVYSGKQLLSYSDGTLALGVDWDRPKIESEAKLLGDFFEEVQDWDLVDSDAGTRVQAEFRFDEMLKEINQAGFSVFAAKEIRLLEGGLESEGARRFPILILKVVRSDDPNIRTFNIKTDDPAVLNKIAKSVRPEDF
jgi:hypothetical protein